MAQIPHTNKRGEIPYSPPPPLVTGDILLQVDDKTMCFMRLALEKGQTQYKWEFKLDFKIWSVAMHPPTNVVAVSEYTPYLYVASEWFLTLVI